MIFNCPDCHQQLETDNDLTGQTVACPSCNHNFTVGARKMAAAAPAPIPSLNQSTLRDAKEGIAFKWLVFFSIVLWLAAILWVVFSLGIALVIIGVMALARYIAGLFAAAYIKTNAVEVTERQFPEIHTIANNFALRIGMPLPTIYVMQAGAWNSVAMRLAGKQFVVLFSGAIDSLLLKGSMTQVAWLVGHELGHHFAGHLNFWRHITAELGSWFIWVGLWYKRRCELTCDRYGLACANNVSESLRAVCNMAVGAQLASEVDIEQAISQWNKHRLEFFVKYRTMYSTHPHTLWRMEELVKAAREMGIQK